MRRLRVFCMTTKERVTGQAFNQLLFLHKLTEHWIILAVAICPYVAADKRICITGLQRPCCVCMSVLNRTGNRFYPSKTYEGSSGRDPASFHYPKKLLNHFSSFSLLPLLGGRAVSYGQQFLPWMWHWPFQSGVAPLAYDSLSPARKGMGRLTGLGSRLL